MKIFYKNEAAGNAMVCAVFIILVLLVGGAACWLWQRHHSQSPSISMASACSDLALAKGTSDGTAGTIYWHAVITNNGAHDCQLTGYPAAFMIDGQSTSVGGVSNSLYAPVSVTLGAHGGKAHTVIGLPEPANFTPGTVICTVATSSTLRLYLPGLTTYLAGAFGESACQGFTVTALQPGA